MFLKFELSLKLFFIALLSSKTEGFNDEIVKFIADITQSNFLPSFFTAFLCYNSQDFLQFSKKISKNDIMHKVLDTRSNLNDEIFHTSEQHLHRHFFIVDFNCPNADEIILKANAMDLFRAPAKWLIIQQANTSKSADSEKFTIDDNTQMSLTNSFGNLTILPDSEVYIAQIMDNNLFKILSVYRINIEKDLITGVNGHWSEVEGLAIYNNEPNSRKRQNLQQMNLKTCLVLTDLNTLNHLTDFGDKKIDGVTKANYFWIQHLVGRMNATMTYTTEYTWGYQDKNGTWNGMIGLLDRKEIDFGGTATFLIPQRLGVIDYYQLYTPVCSRFIFRKPPLSYVKNLFTLPFDYLVWYTICIILCMIIGFLYLVMKCEWIQVIKDPTAVIVDNEMIEKPGISDNLLIILGAVFQQGTYYNPRHISSRILILTLLLSALSLYVSYTANIVALLQSTSSSIKTIRDLTYSGLKIGIYDIVYNRYYFYAMVQDPSRKEFLHRFILNKTSVWMTLEDGIERVRKGLFAFHADATAAHQLIQETYQEEEKCGLHEIDYLNLLFPMLVLPLYSPYREMFRVGALWIRESGLQHRINRRLFTEKPICSGQTSFVSVGTIDCYAAFYLILSGVIIAIGIFFMEVIHYKCYKKFNKETEQSAFNSESAAEVSDIMD